MAVSVDVGVPEHRVTMKKKAKIDKKVLLVAQEIKLAKILAGNNEKLRNRTLKNLEKWFANRHKTMPFTEDDFMRIWKGLFYYMWMSDKPLVQEECAENISKLLHNFDTAVSLVFFKCFLKTMMLEWYGIDQLRLDKFQMLVRRMLRQALIILKSNKWSPVAISCFDDAIAETVLQSDSQLPLGLTMHFTEIYLEELAKVSRGKLSPNMVTALLVPFARQLATLKDGRQIKHIMRFTFRHLMRQSDAGIEYQEKFKAWKKQGFPGGSIDFMEKVIIEEPEQANDADYDDGDDGPMDPRAGRVDVELPQILFDPLQIHDMLMKFKSIPGTNTKSRKSLSRLAEEYKKLSEGVFPLGVKQVRLPTKDHSINIRKSVNELVKFEKKLVEKGMPKKLLKKRKHKEKKVKQKLLTLAKEQKINLKTKNRDDSDLTAFIDKSESEIFTKVYAAETSTEEKKVKPKLLALTKNLENKPKTLSAKNKDDSVLNASVNKSKSGIFGGIRFAEIPAESSVTKRKHRLDDLPEAKKPLVNKKRHSLGSWHVEMSPSLNEAEKIRTMKRKHSLPNLVKNPFAESTPKLKRVKIMLNLNQEQETHDYLQQVKNSPGIPFDANKKPLKPLLKRNSIGSPIYPFLNE